MFVESLLSVKKDLVKVTDTNLKSKNVEIFFILSYLLFGTSFVPLKQAFFILIASKIHFFELVHNAQTHIHLCKYFFTQPVKIILFQFLKLLALCSQMQVLKANTIN